MIDEDLLHTLARPAGPTTVRPLSSIVSRAGVLRHRRRSAGVIAMSLVAALAVVGAVNLVRDTSPGPALVPAAESPDCSSGFTRVIAPRDISDSLYLAPESLTGPVTRPARAVRDTPACVPATAEAVWYSMTDGKVSRTLVITGPHEADPYVSGGLDTEFDGTKPRIVDINGAAGTLYYFTPERRGKLFWTTHDGSQWKAVIQGMGLVQTVDAVRGVSLTGSEVDRTQLPPHVSTSVPLQTGPAYRGGPEEWSMGFGARDSEWGLSISSFGHRPLEPALGDRRVEVNGQAGWLSDDGISWSLPSGVVGSVRGAVSPEKALAVARATVKVDLDDPRLKRLLTP